MGGLNQPSTVLSHDNIPLMSSTIPMSLMSAEDEASLQLNMQNSCKNTTFGRQAHLS